ncbi:hypothetical protein CcCBS67573_g08304 [Chytriomyces confervae]|uniref:Peptidase M20 dimerisation domain-containing protein n=1 Tax=Chytriomyces confervae TaxID=246404 RepID=A0A507ENN7_9FUNG|nr:hypothetical protein CcCBS67573_g08304 [Chytriomyces confervae]
MKASATHLRQRPLVSVLLPAAFLILLLQSVHQFGLPTFSINSAPKNTTRTCVQCEPLAPAFNQALSIARFNEAQFIAAASLHLSAAVQTRTESFDEEFHGDEYERVFAPFRRFHSLLQQNYPLVHSHLERTIVANYSLLYTWKGSNPSAAPLILMAHIDVVPVLPDTVNQWTHEPFGGTIDTEGGFVWGRGAGDNKANLIGIMEAVEQLLKAGWLQPTRTVYLAFGHDEESFGSGGLALAKHFEEKLGLAGKVGLIVDEGSGQINLLGLPIEAVSVSEKGYVDVDIIVETKGGHSSVPPKHTGIGYSALLIEALESQELEAKVSAKNPFIGALRCYAEHAPSPDPFIQWALDNLPASGPLLVEMMEKVLPHSSIIFKTTQAVDVIRGGLKVNALPEKVVTTVNYRISSDSSLQEMEDFYHKALSKVVHQQRLNITIQSFRNPAHGSKSMEWPDAVGKVTISPKLGLEPSPISPFHTSKDPGWSVLEGTIHHIALNESPSNNVIVAPFLMGGNTDTKSYWNLSKSIYRYGPAGGENIHTVDEHVSIADFIKGIKFYHELIRNWSALE